MRRLSIIVALFAAHPLAAQPALEAAWRACERRDATTPPPAAIAGCTAVLAAPGQDDASRALAHFNRAVMRHVLGEVAPALADFNAALAPRFALAYANRGDLWREVGQPEAALADYRIAILLGPNDPTPFLGRAALRQAEGDRDAALADLDAALRVAPRDPAVIAARAALLAAPAAALPASAPTAEAVPAQPPADPAARLAALDARPDAAPADVALRAVLRYRLRDAAGSQADISRAIRAAAPDEGSAHAARAGIGLLRRSPFVAIYLAEALRREPGNPLALALRAVHRARLGDHPAAAADAAEARRLAPGIAAQLAETFGLTLP